MMCGLEQEQPISLNIKEKRVFNIWGHRKTWVMIILFEELKKLDNIGFFFI